MTTVHFLIRPKIVISRQTCIKKVCAETAHSLQSEKGGDFGDEFCPTVHDPVSVTSPCVMYS